MPKRGRVEIRMCFIIHNIEQKGWLINGITLINVVQIDSEYLFSCRKLECNLHYIKDKATRALNCFSSQYKGK